MNDNMLTLKLWTRGFIAGAFVILIGATAGYGCNKHDNETKLAAEKTQHMKLELDLLHEEAMGNYIRSR